MGRERRALTIKLSTGELTVKTGEELLSLTGFGSRPNKRRGFVFVSKVLGKHIAVRPSVAEGAATLLAALIKREIDCKPVVVIGFAETATGLGNCLYEKLDIEDSFYIHTTRYRFSSNMLLQFIEEHCHAPSHYLYDVKDASLKDILHAARTVVLIDDEITTGNTIRNIVLKLKDALPEVKSYIAASYLNWMTETVDGIRFVSLLNGEVEFNKGPTTFTDSFTSECLHSSEMDSVIPYNFGRFGIRKVGINGKALVDINGLRGGKRVLVLGTGEFMYVPFLLAKWLEQNDVNVYFQATTRSPLNVDGDIKSAIRFKDNYHEDIDNFLYNVTHSLYDVILICYETPVIPDSHRLKDILTGYAADVKEIFMLPP
ncbi:MAG: phosphoribosyltransferase domain-containing protein [Nitrospirae bacterium]|nr:phosphoribosyltransferase domain-containing protein [Nitrospirota bacterium]